MYKLQQQFVSINSSSSSFDKENTTNIVKKMYFFYQTWYKKYLDNEMGDEVLSPLFFHLWPSVHLCIISHHYNASESYFKEILRIRDILIHHKSLNLVNSLLLAYAPSVEVWDNMASLQWFLNDWHVGTVNKV